MATSDPFSTCRRRAMPALVGGVALLAVSWAASAGNWPIAANLRGALAGIGVGLLFAAALLWFSPNLTDTAPRHLSRRYKREVWPMISAYMLVMLGWKRLLGMVDATWLKVLVALFPALLVLGVMRAFVRYVRDSDEMQRRIELESGSIAGLTVSGVYLAAGFLQTASLIDIPAKVAMVWVFPMLCMVYGIAKVVIGRRYQ